MNQVFMKCIMTWVRNVWTSVVGSNMSNQNLELWSLGERKRGAVAYRSLVVAKKKSSSCVIVVILWMNRCLSCSLISSLQCYRVDTLSLSPTLCPVSHRLSSSSSLSTLWLRLRGNSTLPSTGVAPSPMCLPGCLTVKRESWNCCPGTPRTTKTLPQRGYAESWKRWHDHGKDVLIHTFLKY